MLAEVKCPSHGKNGYDQAKPSIHPEFLSRVAAAGQGFFSAVQAPPSNPQRDPGNRHARSGVVLLRTGGHFGPFLQGQNALGAKYECIMVSATSVPRMICPRCNKATTDVARCSTCGAPVKSLVSQQRRGWVAFGGGAFLAVFMAAVWIWIDQLFAGNGIAQRDPAAARFLGRINVACALVVLSGLFGVANGWIMAHSGRRNLALMVAMLVVFVAALFLAFTASNGYHPQ